MAAANTSNKKQTIKTHRESYRNVFTKVADPFKYAQDRDKVIRREISEAQERVNAFPNDDSEHEFLIQLTMEAQAMWEVCETMLRSNAMEQDADKTLIATQINQSHANAAEYRSMFSVAIKNQLSNTSSLYKAGQSMQTTGKAMQNVGDAMSSAGNKMTIGFTIPIIVAIILFFLFIFLF